MVFVFLWLTYFIAFLKEAKESKQVMLAHAAELFGLMETWNSGKTPSGCKHFRELDSPWNIT